ncbi:MAG: hypothetical protein FH761_12880 [Firmicutes bacterium]|nr:hypothetical protein [Bacillota bacterium]
MIISIASPKKGLGQTVTAINITAMIVRLIEEPSLIIDTNKYCKGISYYLSDSQVTKGLDEFKCLLDLDMLNSKIKFDSCTKHVSENIDIMDSNESQGLCKNDISLLAGLVRKYYPTTIIDTAYDSDTMNDYLFSESDIIVIILNQDRSLLQEIINNKAYRKYKDKVIFVVNKYMDSYRNQNIKFTRKLINNHLKKNGFKDNKIFKLDFDAEIINECNNNSILNYVLNKSTINGGYLLQLRRLVEYIMTNCTKHDTFEIPIESDNKRKAFFSMFNITKGRGILNE